MSYSYETREDGLYLLTGKKDKEKDIVVKLGSCVQDTTVMEALTRTTYSLLWTLEKGDTDDILVLKGIIDNQTYEIDMDAEKVVNQLVNMVQKNLTLESCSEITNTLDTGFEMIFNDFLRDKGLLLCSNNIVKGYVVVRNKGKIIGTANRFIYSSVGDLKICEYVGKSITVDMPITISVTIGRTLIKFRNRSSLTDSEIIYNSEVHTLGYFGYEAGIYNITEADEDTEAPIVHEIDVPRYYTTPEEMNTYCTEHNSLEEIERYRISLKPKVQLIDINKFMLREFTV